MRAGRGRAAAAPLPPALLPLSPAAPPLNGRRGRARAVPARPGKEKAGGASAAGLRERVGGARQAAAAGRGGRGRVRNGRGSGGGGAGLTARRRRWALPGAGRSVPLVAVVSMCSPRGRSGGRCAQAEVCFPVPPGKAAVPVRGRAAPPAACRGRTLPAVRPPRLPEGASELPAPSSAGNFADGHLQPPRARLCRQAGERLHSAGLCSFLGGDRCL